MNPYKTMLFILAAALVSSCNRFLDAIPDRSLSVPSTVEEYQQLLNFNRFYISHPSVTDFSIGELDVPYTYWNTQNTRFRNSYIWATDTYEGDLSLAANLDWDNPYYTIYHANVVLDGLANIAIQDRDAYNNVKGRALFLRAFHHLIVQEIFGQPYRPESATSDLGIPLRLSSDLEAPIERASVQQTFDRIIMDAKEALSLLSADYQAEHLYDASKAAASALLARTYLIMQDYPQALDYAETSLVYYDILLDFNKLAPTYQFPNNSWTEVIFYSQETATAGIFNNTSVTVDPMLTDLYDIDDLRLKTFFRWNESLSAYNFNSFYTGERSPFSGLATDEIYLIRAECQARLGNDSGALDDLNRLLVHRYETGKFKPLALSETPDVLATVLEERRKELILRNTRWSDLRRLNQDLRFAVTLQRELNGQSYELPPNDPRYALLIPPREVQLSNLIQNTR